MSFRTRRHIEALCYKTKKNGARFFRFGTPLFNFNHNHSRDQRTSLLFLDNLVSLKTSLDLCKYLITFYRIGINLCQNALIKNTSLMQGISYWNSFSVEKMFPMVCLIHNNRWIIINP